MKYNQQSSKYHFETICIFCWGLIGDVFIRIPVIELIKKHYPDAKITCLVDPVGKQVLQNHPDIENVFVFSRDKSQKIAYILQTIQNIIKLRRKKFDLTVNLYSGGSSPLISNLINANVRLGFDHTKALRHSNTLLAKHPEFCRQWILDFATILNPLGVSEDRVRIGTSFYYSASDSEYAKRTLVNNDMRYFCINLGARVVTKCWDIDFFVQTAERISTKYGYTPVIISNPGMEERANEFSKKYKGDMIKLPTLTLGEVGAIIARSDYMITGDTSIMHVSFGVKTPTLVIFTYTRPEWHIVEDCPCVFCFKEDYNSANWKCNKPWGSKDINVSEVCRKFDKLVDLVENK